MAEPGMLKFSIKEQNVLAELCALAGSAQHSVMSNAEVNLEELGEKFATIIEKFCANNAVNYGDLYDRFHRSGANSL